MHLRSSVPLPSATVSADRDYRAEVAAPGVLQKSARKIKSPSRQRPMILKVQFKMCQNSRWNSQPGYELATIPIGSGTARSDREAHNRWKVPSN